jgi:hypothetical protein
MTGRQPPLQGQPSVRGTKDRQKREYGLRSPANWSRGGEVDRVESASYLVCHVIASGLLALTAPPGRPHARRLPVGSRGWLRIKQETVSKVTMSP